MQQIIASDCRLQMFDYCSRLTKNVGGRTNQAIRIFVCGPTVYDYMHVGHARMLLTYDLICRFFRFCGRTTQVVVNVTDIDSKVFEKSKRLNISPAALTTKYISEMLQDAAVLGLMEFAYARVSDYLPFAAELVRKMLHQGLAYLAGGNVYLKMNLVKDYGSIAHMSKRDIDECRLDISEAKINPNDILLWNASEQFPLKYYHQDIGEGIPWWHMQDTSVAMANFGGIYDIHGGAGELAYPHHESHRAQLSVLTDNTKPVSHWTYVGLVRVRGGQKMSKSAGNAARLRDVLRVAGPNALRLYCYSHNYKEDMIFDEDALFEFVQKDVDILESLSEQRPLTGDNKLLMQFLDRIGNDLDTTAAIKVLDRALTSKDPDLSRMTQVLGLQY